MFVQITSKHYFTSKTEGSSTMKCSFESFRKEMKYHLCRPSTQGVSGQRWNMGNLLKAVYALWQAVIVNN